MTVAVQQPQIRPKKDPLDMIQQALGIASTLYGVSLDKDKTDALIEQNRLANARQTQMDEQATQDREINHLKDWAPAKETDPGAVNLPGRQGFFLPRAITMKREEMASKENELANKKDKPQQMTAGAATEVGEMMAVNKMIDNLEKQYKEAASVGGAGISSLIPGSKAANYLQDKKASTQAIGVVLEKGKMTDNDRLFYQSMMPDPWDTNEKAKAKIDALRRYAKTKQEAQISGLKQGGFDVSGIEPPSESKPVDFKSHGSGSAQAAPASHPNVKQNGHTYIWNEATGSYE